MITSLNGCDIRYRVSRNEAYVYLQEKFVEHIYCDVLSFMIIIHIGLDL